MKTILIMKLLIYNKINKQNKKIISKIIILMKIIKIFNYTI